MVIFNAVCAAVKKPHFGGSLVGIVVLTVIPYVHLGIIHKQFWSPDKTPVSTKDCKCACWDTIFKGSYQKQPAGYKHVYFNITFNTLCIWLLTVVSLVGFYESLKYIYGLLTSANLRWSMFALYLSSIYPHYYTWWMYFNAINDRFYEQFYHQTLFTVTELVVTVIVLSMCKASNDVRLRYLLIIIAIGLSHIVAGFNDNFIWNVIKRRGAAYRKARDSAMVFSDLLSVFVAVVELIKYSKQYCVNQEKICTLKNVMGTVGFVIMFWVLTRIQ